MIGRFISTLLIALALVVGAFSGSLFASVDEVVDRPAIDGNVGEATADLITRLKEIEKTLVSLDEEIREAGKEQQLCREDIRKLGKEVREVRQAASAKDPEIVKANTRIAELQGEIAKLRELISNRLASNSQYAEAADSQQRGFDRLSSLRERRKESGYRKWQLKKEMKELKKEIEKRASDAKSD